MSGLRKSGGSGIGVSKVGVGPERAKTKCIKQIISDPTKYIDQARFDTKKPLYRTTGFIQVIQTGAAENVT